MCCDIDCEIICVFLSIYDTAYHRKTFSQNYSDFNANQTKYLRVACEKESSFGLDQSYNPEQLVEVFVGLSQVTRH